MTLAVLNIGVGDTKLTFDRDKPEELERTRRIVTDMLKLGYAILVKIGGTETKPDFRRATGFDPEHDEYLISDVPAGEASLEPPKKLRRGRAPRRVPAQGTPAVAVARSAGGMSDAADSVEIENLERFDNHAGVRNALRALASERDHWAGIPMPLQDMDLVVEPKYAYAAAFQSLNPPEPDDYEKNCTVRNRFWSTWKRREIIVWSEPSGRIEWGAGGQRGHHFDLDFATMGASVAWGVEQEAAAVQLLAGMLPHHAFKKYLLTGMFLERSARSGLYYVFRRLKPTIAASGSTGEMRIVAALCQHPIAYYSGTWAGAMCPTDDVVAHLTLMRGDEALYWRRCNQHPAWRPEAGL